MKIINFLRDESGASAAEYALILAVIGAAIATAGALLADEIADSMTVADTKIENSQTNTQDDGNP